MHCYPVTISRRAKIPNQSLDRYCAYFYGEDNFLSSFILLLASCFLLVLTVARYAFEQTVNNLLNHLMKSVQDLRTDLGLIQISFGERSKLFYATIAKEGPPATHILTALQINVDDGNDFFVNVSAEQELSLRTSHK